MNLSQKLDKLVTGTSFSVSNNSSQKIYRWMHVTGSTALLMTVALLVIFPFVWLVILSFRSNLEILSNPLGFPDKWQWKNYVELFIDPQIAFYRYILNSVIVVSMGIVMTLILSCLGGYGFSRRRFAFPYRDTVFAILLLAMMLPPQAMYIPQFTLLVKYGLTNSHLGLALIYTAYHISVGAFLIRAYFYKIPEDLEEAARIDGAGEFYIFFWVMLPLCKPVLVTLIVIKFLGMWNELLLALTMVTRPEMRTLPLALMNFIGENSADFSLAAAALVVGTLPVILLYLKLGEKVISGVTAGAIKG